MVARQTVLPDPDEDTLRIMLSTDNHLGYAERDPVRRECPKCVLIDQGCLAHSCYPQEWTRLLHLKKSCT